MQGNGESTRGGTSLMGAGGGGGAGGRWRHEMGSSNFGATIIGEATNEAVTEVAMGLDEKAGEPSGARRGRSTGWLPMSTART